MNKKYIVLAAIVGSSMGLASCSDFWMRCQTSVRK